LIDISLILPSRSRVALLRELLISVRKNATDISRVEVNVAVDSDDAMTLDQMGNLKSHFPFTDFYVLERKQNLSAGYYNPLAALSNGRTIWALNDDSRLTSPRWDQLIIDRARDADNQWGANSAWYGRTKDTNFGTYSCFPIQSRRAVELTGYFFHPHVIGWGADQGAYKLWSGLGRVMEIPVWVQHLSWHHGNRDQDEVNVSVQAMSRSFHEGGGNLSVIDGEIERIRAILKP
jgi:hypothetical protein